MTALPRGFEIDDDAKQGPLSVLSLMLVSTRSIDRSISGLLITHIKPMKGMLMTTSNLFVIITRQNVMIATSNVIQSKTFNLFDVRHVKPRVWLWICQPLNLCLSCLSIKNSVSELSDRNQSIGYNQQTSGE